jgi:hypothetical protein
VIQAQRDLAVARNNETQALLDYQLSSVTFEAVQLSGTANSNQIISGASAGAVR